MHCDRCPYIPTINNFCCDHFLKILNLNCTSIIGQRKLKCCLHSIVVLMQIYLVNHFVCYWTPWNNLKKKDNRIVKLDNNMVKGGFEGSMVWKIVLIGNQRCRISGRLYEERGKRRGFPKQFNASRIWKRRCLVHTIFFLQI